MKLFQSTQPLQNVNSNILFYPTPLGNVYFNLIFNGDEIFSIKPLKTEFRDKTTISCWDLDECYVEFLQTHIVPQIPSSMKIEASIAGIWRIKSLSKALFPVMKVHLDTKYEGSPDSGEGLISQSFENDTFNLSIGTEDEDYLSERARAQKWMPERLQNVLSSSAIEYIPNGIQFNSPQLEQSECIQIQFIVAWSLKKYPEASSWFAVDQSPDYILKSLDMT